MFDDPFTTDTETDSSAVVTIDPDSGVSEITVTLKGGRDFDSPWVVMRAPSVSAALGALDGEMQELLRATAKYGKGFTVLGSEGKPASKGARPVPGHKDHPTGREEFCSHGKMAFKSGIAKTGKNAGKPWEAFDCPDGNCPRKWVND